MAKCWRSRHNSNASNGPHVPELKDVQAGRSRDYERRARWNRCSRSHAGQEASEALAALADNAFAAQEQDRGNLLFSD
ncbi:MAG: hypothetical protein IPF57_24685 [Gammaproteobacteria bacterium]|nr:hypothetical protein [Gammaproteobacteria bacterium]